MSPLAMPPLAVLLEDDGHQELVIPVNSVELFPGARVFQIATIWTAQQSAN